MLDKLKSYEIKKNIYIIFSQFYINNNRKKSSIYYIYN